MTSRYYDVVVLGRSLGALVAATLLARRDFRVLLLGQGQRPASYGFEGRSLRRRSFTLLFGHSPVWKRILHELAQTPTFRRKATALDPMFGVLSVGRRIQVPPDMQLFSGEIKREFPEVRQLVDELYATFARANAATDALFERDAVWPPGSWWERLEVGRAGGPLPFANATSAEQVLGKFPPGHPYREIALIPAMFASDLTNNGNDLPPLALARLHGSWTRGVLALGRGEEELSEFLLERFEAHGGLCSLNRNVSKLLIRRGAVAGVYEEGEEEPIGTDAIVCDQPGEQIAEWADGQGITKAALREWPRMTATAGRFVVSMVVKRSGLPEPLPAESFLVPTQGLGRDPRHPVVHLQQVDNDSTRGPHGDESLLVAEALVPLRGPLTLLEARHAVLGVVREHIPFLEENLRVVDSPHDGLPLQGYAAGGCREIDRIHVSESGPSAEAMPYLWSVDPLGYLGLAAEPVRGPIVGSYLVGKTVLPALGQEGELLAAWSAVRLITRKDRLRQKMRRQMWTKVET